MNLRTLRRAWPSSATLVLALAACTDTTAPVPATAPRGAVTTVARGAERLATIEYEGRFPALYLQNVDGSARLRVHFEHVYDHVAGNYPQSILPVTDRSLIAMGPAKWSPDGTKLAVVVTPAFDATQIVVMDANGRNIHTVSPNGQVIMGDIDWSPDGKMIAYAMSTQPRAMAVDLFVTELGRDAVKRITTEGRMGVYDDYRFDAKGTGLWLTRFEGWTDDQVNRVYRVYHATLDGALEGVEAKIVGNPMGITRDGRWALATRERAGDWYNRDLYRVPLGGRDAELRLAEGDLQYTKLFEGDEEALLVRARPEGGMAFTRIGLAAADDVRGELAAGTNAWQVAYTPGN